MLIPGRHCFVRALHSPIGDTSEETNLCTGPPGIQPRRHQPIPRVLPRGERAWKRCRRQTECVRPLLANCSFPDVAPPLYCLFSYDAISGEHKPYPVLVDNHLQAQDGNRVWLGE